jgi:hypothetical protein
MDDQTQFWEWLDRVENPVDVAETEYAKLVAAAKEYDTHLLVAGQFYYTLPVDLLNKVVAEIGPGRFEPDMIDMEVTLAKPCGDHSRFVGYWQGSWVFYDGLRFRRTRLLSERDKLLMWPHLQDLLRPMHLYDLDWDYPVLRRDYRSYAGWLLTNKDFLDEHDGLISRNVEAIRRWGTEHDHMPAAQVIYSNEKMNPENDQEWIDFAAERNEFLLRWRLAGLEGPYLPVPLEPLMNGRIPSDVLSRLLEVGNVYFVPDIVPLASRDELRESMDEARRRRSQAEHLAEWFKIIRPDNSARNQLERFARIFELQHYWRILFDRHRKALKGGVGKLEIAFAHWFGVSTETIHQDLINIRRRLGGDWLERCWPI